MSKRCESSSHDTGPLTFSAQATPASVQFPWWILRPQTSGPLQVLFPPSGHLFSGTSSGEHFLLLELISVGSLQEEVPDPLDKVKASYSMLSLSSMDVSPLHTSRLTLTHSLCDSLAHMDSPRPADG